jgi:peptidoglycan/LPS O-acetylase OafA/YrhL
VAPGHAAHDAYRAAARFPSLDGLRCVAILPVVWHHATLGPLPGILGRGPLGVDLFFAISGFLITTLLLRERDDTGRVSARAFYARRTLRIFPLYYAVLGLYVLYAWLGMTPGAQRTHFWQSLPFFATYTTNWFVHFGVPHPVSFAFAWSLATEEQFYLLWPWIVRTRSRWVVPTMVATTLLLVQEGVAHGWWVLVPGSLGQRIALSLAPPICMGALLAMALHGRGAYCVLYRLLGGRWSAAAMFAGMVLTAWLDGVPLWLAQLVLTLVVGACVVRPDHSLVRILELRAVRWIGTVSYGIYLMHVGVITAVRTLLPSRFGQPGIVFALAVPVTVLVASVSYRFFEEPLLRLRARFRPAAQSAFSAQRSRPASFAR